MVQKSFSKGFGRQIGSQNHSLDPRCFSLKIKTMFNITGQHLVAAAYSVAKSCPTLSNSVNCSRPGFSVLHYLLEISLESVMLSNHLILCHSLLFLPSIFPSIRSFPLSWFSSGGQSIGASASATVLPVNIQCWLPLGLTDLISLQSKGLSTVFSSTTIWKHLA